MIKAEVCNIKKNYFMIFLFVVFSGANLLLPQLAQAGEIFKVPAFDCNTSGAVDGSDLLAFVGKVVEFESTEAELELETQARLPKEFTPSRIVTAQDGTQKEVIDLVEVPNEISIKSKHRLRAEVVEKIKLMFADAQKNFGHKFLVYSGYRSYQDQCSAFRAKFTKFGENENFQNRYRDSNGQVDVERFSKALEQYVQEISAMPGRSEHQLGTAFDLTYACVGNKLNRPDTDGRQCKEWTWLLENAHKYGFALSFPRINATTKEEYNPNTGYKSEPWHWRFVGVDHAQKIFDLSQEFGRRISINEYIKFTKNILSVDSLKENKKGELYLQKLKTKSKTAAKTNNSKSDSTIIDTTIDTRAPSSVTEIVIGMGGDVSLSKPGSDVLSAEGGKFSDKLTPWSDMTKGLVQWTQGNDFNFINAETVISDKTNSKLSGQGQKFAQKAHPAGIEAIIRELNINLISLANNHATDYGLIGMQETLSNLEKINDRLAQSNLNFGPIYYTGIGKLGEVEKPIIIEKNGLKIAFASIGMKGDGREVLGYPIENQVGMLSVRRCGDFNDKTSVDKLKFEFDGKLCKDNQYGDLEEVVKNLNASKADLKILSIHEGEELSVHIKDGIKPDADAHEFFKNQQRQRQEKRNIMVKFAKAQGVDLIIGHHSHNVRPITFNEGQLALYGLGNFIFLGGQNYNSRFPFWNRFGLFARSYYSFNPQKAKLELAALELVPLKDIHLNPKIWEPSEAKKYIEFINKINHCNSLQFKGDSCKDIDPQQSLSGLQFKITSDGRGIYCNPEVAKGVRAEQICAD